LASSLLDRAIYSYADVDRLVGLHSGTARRWLEGYEGLGRFYDPVLRQEPSGSDAVTWGEMVEARLLAEFRDRKLPVQRMRPAIGRLREEFGPYPLAHARPFLEVEGRELVQIVQSRWGSSGSSSWWWCVMGSTSSPRPQSGSAPRLSTRARSLACSGPKCGRRRWGWTRGDPSGSQPSANVRTESLGEDYRAGTGRDELADLYDLTLEQVDSAIRFELIAGAERAA